MKAIARQFTSCRFSPSPPSLILHIPLLVLSYKAPASSSRLWYCILQFLFFIPPASLCLWMVNRFLVRELDRRYEPTIMASTSAGILPMGFSPSELPAYCDSTDSCSAWPISSISTQLESAPYGHLGAAYSGQLALASSTRRRIESHNASSSSMPHGRPDDETFSAADAPNLTTFTRSNRSNNPQSRCPTVARFDYMPQGRIGPHSWVSQPIVPLVLGGMNTWILILLCGLNYENQRTRIPSS